MGCSSSSDKKKPSNDSKCSHCSKGFEPGETMKTITLPGDAATGTVHLRCENDWRKKHAKKCDHCDDPMTTQIITITADWGKGKVHPECEMAYTRKKEEKHNKKKNK
eukprot:TRINITY_DN3821_c0_g2_i1.p2 TRINITY_DN3821_c0_g2~~TRINITY_DN3821_c0_g2_i1.p2  ORF type:complete len:107 (+),score=22.08 TRINITY_DN3821_c0_g2_i1:67-387(+)